MFEVGTYHESLHNMSSLLWDLEKGEAFPSEDGSSWLRAKRRHHWECGQHRSVQNSSGEERVPGPVLGADANRSGVGLIPGLGEL